MSQFVVTAYPAIVLSDGIVQIEITRCIARDVIDCTTQGIQAELKKFAEENRGQRTCVSVHAGPVGRAPNGWSKVVAAHQDRLTYVAETTTA